VKVLFLTHRLPYAPNRGDRVRAFHIVRTLAPVVDLEVVSLVHDREELSHLDAVRALGARVSAYMVPRARNYCRAAVRLAGTTPLTHLLLDAPDIARGIETLVQERPPDVVLAFCSGMARFALESPLANCPLVLDLVDVDSEKWRVLAESSSWGKGWLYRREAHLLGDFERQAARKATVTMVVNEREAASLRRLAPDADVLVMANGVDVAALRPNGGPTEQPRIVFCGVMNYEPNVDGVLWFARDVWPLVRAKRPDARFVVVGSAPGRTIRSLAAAGSGIEVAGAVPDVRPYLWNAAISVAPLKTARGLQNKVLEAVAAGLPTVVTSEVSGGLPPFVTPACRVADSPESFADQTLALLECSGTKRRALAAQADLSQSTWSAQLASLHAALTSAVRLELPSLPLVR
jgi:sugar transferase (PEP-CTERM/EpsH1 system associated)